LLRICEDHPELTCQHQGFRQKKGVCWKLEKKYNLKRREYSYYSWSHCQEEHLETRSHGCMFAFMCMSCSL
jgi:hypothetical protein